MVEIEEIIECLESVEVYADRDYYEEEKVFDLTDTEYSAEVAAVEIEDLLGELGMDISDMDVKVVTNDGKVIVRASVMYETVVGEGYDGFEQMCSLVTGSTLMVTAITRPNMTQEMCTMVSMAAEEHKDSVEVDADG